MAKQPTGASLLASLADPIEDDGKNAKSRTPSIEAPAKLHTHIKSWIENERMEKTGKAGRIAAEGELIPEALKIREDKCKEARSILPSIRLLAPGIGSILMTYKCAFKAMQATVQDELQKIFGEVGFAKYFTVTPSFTLDTDYLDEHPELAKKILTAVGREHAQKLLKIKTVVKPNAAYYHDMVFGDKEFQQARQTAEIAGLCEPYKPSFSAK